MGWNRDKYRCQDQNLHETVAGCYQEILSLLLQTCQCQTCVASGANILKSFGSLSRPLEVSIVYGGFVA